MNTQDLYHHLIHQLSFFDQEIQKSSALLKEAFQMALSDTIDTISTYKALPKKFSIYQTHHNALFLYKLARILHLNKHNNLSEKIYLLNRMLNGVDLFYKIDMPKNFIIGHGIGTIFSNASYANYLVVFQNVTIGTQDGKYPTIGEKVVIYPNCVISGNTTIGDNSVIGAGTVLINKNIPANSIAYSKNGQLYIKENKQNIIQTYFDL